MNAADDHREELHSHDRSTHNSHNAICNTMAGMQTPGENQSSRSTTGYELAKDAPPWGDPGSS